MTLLLSSLTGIPVLPFLPGKVIARTQETLPLMNGKWEPWEKRPGRKEPRLPGRAECLKSLRLSAPEALR